MKAGKWTITAPDYKCQEPSVRCHESGGVVLLLTKVMTRVFAEKSLASHLYCHQISYGPLFDVNTIKVFVKITQVTMMGSLRASQIWPVSGFGHSVITLDRQI